MLVAGASVIDHARRMRGKGVVGAPNIDWPELIEKFVMLAGPSYGPNRCRRIVDLVRDLHALDDVRTLTAALGA